MPVCRVPIHSQFLSWMIEKCIKVIKVLYLPFQPSAAICSFHISAAVACEPFFIISCALQAAANKPLPHLLVKFLFKAQPQSYLVHKASRAPGWISLFPFHLYLLFSVVLLQQFSRMVDFLRKKNVSFSPSISTALIYICI